MFLKEFFLASSLEKVLPTKRPNTLPSGARLSTWPGARATVQLIYYLSGQADNGVGAPLEVFSVAMDGAPGEVTIRKVQLMPVEIPCPPGADDDYISKQPGLYPDLLLPMQTPQIPFVWNQYRSLWITFDIPEGVAAGEYPVRIRITNPDGVMNSWYSGVFEPPTPHQVDNRELKLTLSVGKCALPPSRVSHIQYLHTDCLADYYHVAPWSEEHWRIVERFIRFAAGHNVHELTTPIVTLALDVAKTADRTTTQLVDVYLDNGVFSFGFSKLERWCKICKACGIHRLNMAPLFSQWGATHTVKVVAIVDGEEQQIFGWHIPATEPLYRRFLQGMIPALRQKLAEFGYDDDHILFCISDEPMPDQVESYEYAYHLMKDLLVGAKISDALFSVEFYHRGIADYPNLPIDHLDPFLDAKVEKLCAYACIGQVKKVPNTFITMPSRRGRILGVLLYLYPQIIRFERWTLNFYNTRYSHFKFNPLTNVNADWNFPDADSYLVYPGDGGEVWSSIRMETLDEVFCDLRALELLEQLTDRDYVLNLIHESAAMSGITMWNYPNSDDYLLFLREKVAAEIDLRL